MRATFWSIVQPTIIDPRDFISGYDCEIEVPDYGPHKARRPDETGHSRSVQQVDMREPGQPHNYWPIVTCECGWRDHAGNWQEHAATFPRREVMW